MVLVLPSKVDDCGLGFHEGGGLGTEYIWVKEKEVIPSSLSPLVRK